MRPILGGNPYIYSTDPITMFDFNGQWGFHIYIHWKSVVHVAIGIAVAAASVAAAGVLCGTGWDVLPLLARSL